MSTVHVVVPAGIDDPRRPTGGNVYDRHVCDGLASRGWSVHEHPVPGSWPWPDATARNALAEVLAALPDAGLVLLDGLIASAVPEILTPQRYRLRMVVLLHMPLGIAHPEARRTERAAMAAAAAVIAPSHWARRWLQATYDLRAARVYVARPGVDVAGPAHGTAAGDSLLCVGAVTPDKGHDVLAAALAELRDVAWSCRLAGALDVAPGFVERLRRRAGVSGIGARLSFLGPLTREDLEAAYAGADVFVLSSRVETYGIVVAEALAHGLPVIATAVGGIPEALGQAPDGRRPGLLVPPGDATALAAAIRSVVTDGGLRSRLRQTAADRGRSLTGWSDTTTRVEHVLNEAAIATSGK